MIVDQLAESIEVRELARHCRISRGYFITAFEASTGLTPHQWRISTRLRRAQELLRSTDLSIAEIALAAGFYDQSHLSRTFARWTGESPGRWRRKANAG